MKPRASDLAAAWGKPDTSVLTPKQTSIRLPVVVASKIDALLEMYPSKNRTEIIGDLLMAALSDFEESLEWEANDEGLYNPEYDVTEFSEFVGTGPRFRRLWQQHLEKYEEQLGQKVQTDTIVNNRNRDDG